MSIWRWSALWGRAAPHYVCAVLFTDPALLPESFINVLPQNRTRLSDVLWPRLPTPGPADLAVTWSPQLTASSIIEQYKQMERTSWHSVADLFCWAGAFFRMARLVFLFNSNPPRTDHHHHHHHHHHPTTPYLVLTPLNLWPLVLVGGVAARTV